MRFDDVAERLAAFPDPLPAPAAVLMPVIVGEAVARGADGSDGSVGSERLPPRMSVAGWPGRPAGVLVLLYPDDAGFARVVLTERAERDGHHSGEVSFPGGMAEPDDADIVATALREAVEEVALDTAAAGVRIVGLLEPFPIPVSDFHVTPVVAVAARRPILAASEAEVARILEPRLAHFLPDGPITVVERTIDGWPLRYGTYVVDGLSVWGATARILNQLGAILAR